MSKKLLIALALCLGIIIQFSAQAQSSEADAAKKRGDAMMKSELYDDAIGEYKKAVAADSSNWENYKALGTAYFKKKDYAAAGETFEKAVALKPDYSAGFYNMGFTYSKSGNYQKAIVGYQKYTQLKSDDPDGFYELAGCYEKVGDKENAVSSYEKYIAVEKRDKKQGQVDEAKQKIASLKQEIEQKKNEPPPVVPTSAPAEETATAVPTTVPEGAFDKNLSKAMEKEGDAHMVKNAYNLAVTSYRDASLRDPQNDAAFYKLGVAYEKTNRNQLALDAYKRAIAVNPNNFEAQERMKALEEKIKSAGKPGQAGVVIEKVGGDADTLYKDGLLANKKGDYQKALALFDQSIQLRLNFAPAHVARGDALMGLGRYDEAIHSYTQALNIDPRLTEPLFGLGEAYMAIGDKLRAKSYLERYLQSAENPSGWRAKRAKQSLSLIDKGE